MCLPLRSSDDAQDHRKAGNGKEALHIGILKSSSGDLPKLWWPTSMLDLSRADAPGVDSVMYLESQREQVMNEDGESERNYQGRLESENAQGMYKGRTGWQ